MRLGSVESATVHKSADCARVAGRWSWCVCVMFSFRLPDAPLRQVAPANQQSTDGAVLSPLAELSQEDLGKFGIEFSSKQLPDEYLFSRMGGWGVTFRGSIIRVAFFKLLGTGIAALLVALLPSTGRYTAFSCVLAAAVNFVACGHYWRICECARFAPPARRSFKAPTR